MMRRLLTVSVVVLIGLCESTPVHADESPRDRMVFGPYFDQLADQLILAWDLDDTALEFQITGRDPVTGAQTPSVIWGLYLPALSPTSGTAPVQVLVRRCLRNGTVLDVQSVSHADYDKFYLVSSGRLAAATVGGPSGSAEEDVEVAELSSLSSYREEVIPAKYETRTTQMCVQPTEMRYEEVPAEYRTIEERVCIAPSRVEWQRVECEPSVASGGAGECWRLVEVPAQFRVVQRRVCVRPAGRREVTVPAQYEAVTEVVVATPARRAIVPSPAQFRVRAKKLRVPEGKRRAGVLLGAAFGDVKGIYFRAGEDAPGVTSELLRSWDRGDARPDEKEWVNLLSSASTSETWSRLAESPSVEGQLYVVATGGSWGPRPFRLVANRMHAIDAPERLAPR